MTHTPGPWDTSASTRTTHARYVGKRAANGSLDMICDLTDSCFPQNAKANAHLIAAAPDLVEALKNALNVLAGLVVGDLKTIKADSPAIAMCRKALAKAEGKGVRTSHDQIAEHRAPE